MCFLTLTVGYTPRPIWGQIFKSAALLEVPYNFDTWQRKQCNNVRKVSFSDCLVGFQYTKTRLRAWCQSHLFSARLALLLRESPRLDPISRFPVIENSTDFATFFSIL